MQILGHHARYIRKTHTEITNERREILCEQIDQAGTSGLRRLSRESSFSKILSVELMDQLWSLHDVKLRKRLFQIFLHWRI